MASLAGCSAAFTEKGERHYVDMFNGSEEPHVFAVTVINETSETSFEHEYDLGPNTGDENRIIDGTPADVTVVTDRTVRVEFPWAPLDSPDFDSAHPDGCPGTTSTGLSI